MKKIQGILSSYEIGQDNVTEIILTKHGSKKTTIYKVTKEDGEYVYVGYINNQHYYEEKTKEEVK